jgi:AMP-polyphosphate phosphotransferase
VKFDFDAFEKGGKYKGDYAADLLALQERLARIQVAHIVRKKPAIIVFEGWDASGKGGAIRRLVAEWDPRWFQVWPIAAPTPEEKNRHFLYRFWTRLPGNGEIAVFDRSWYGRVLVERVEGYCSKAEWKRGFDEIDEFEAQQHQEGATIVKLFMHVTQDEQDKRLRDRLESPWKQWKIAPDDFRNRARRADYLKAYAEMFKRTDTKAAPWTVIDGNNKKAARIAALTAIADQLEAQVDMAPLPVDPELVTLAETALGGPIETGGSSDGD